MNVRKSNPLNALYHLWVELGGHADYVPVTGTGQSAPTVYNDNLCHFMRVVLIWVWFRWLFKRRWMFKEIKGGIILSPFIIGLATFLLGVLTTMMVHYPDFRLLIIFTAIFLSCMLGVVYVIEKTKLGGYLIENQKRGNLRRQKWWAPKKEAFQLFKDWLYAKKMRVCPQIKVDL